jgi:tRNA threonylcarbamoyladenosine biosynthesis protein TsaE
LSKCRVRTLSVEETRSVGESIGSSVPEGTIILLSGDLGCGKTVLTRGIAKAQGIPEDEISSPSFNIVHEYDSLVHIDLYRLDSIEALEDLGFEEILLDRRIKVIEWPQMAVDYFKESELLIVEINCSFCGNDEREFEIVDTVGNKLCQKLENKLESGGFYVKDS